MIRLVEAKELGDYSGRTMTKTLFLALLAGTCLTVPAAAQTEMYPGQNVTVNLGAIHGRGTGHASPYARSGYAGVIHLHMPAPAVHRHHVAAKPKPVTTDVASTAPAPVAAPAPASPPPAQSKSPYPPPLDSFTDTSAPAPAPAKHHVKQAAAPAPTPAASDDNSGQDAALPLSLDPQAPHPVSQAPKHKRQKTASVDTTTTTTTTTTVVSSPDSSAKNGLTRRTEILFPRGDPEISTSTVDKMRAVAADLNTLLGAGATRVQLDAYGGAPGDKGSDARRLSLKRALGIRQLLIEDGIPSEKIDVRALGGIDDSGAPDRVDVMVRGG